jgi:REP element-mobilizing transposase RayT
MARKPRIHFPGALYHVISRGNRQQDIFLDERDHKKFLSYLSEYKNRYSFRLYAYALMKNHFHLLVEVEGTPLSRIMQALLFRYTRYFNWRYGKVGHLFQGRYRAILCDKDEYLLELVRYIHLNPVRAEIVSMPEEYRWTGHLSYLGRVKENDLVDKDLVLSLFGKEESEAGRRYREFLMDRVQDGHQSKYYEVKDQRYLGEEEFIERVEVAAKIPEGMVYDIPIDVIVREVSHCTGVDLGKFYSLTRDRKGAYGRNMTAYLARAVTGCLVKDVAQHFGRSPITMSQGLIKFEESLRNNGPLLEKIMEIKSELVKIGKRKYHVTIA